jgi:hypothetical protein
VEVEQYLLVYSEVHGNITIKSLTEPEAISLSTESEARSKPLTNSQRETQRGKSRMFCVFRTSTQRELVERIAEDVIGSQITSVPINTYLNEPVAPEGIG